MKSESNLFQIALATGAPRVFSRPRKDGKQDGREDRYNRYYDQKFDEGKTASSWHFPLLL
jgi:hypothetical protein